MLQFNDILPLLLKSSKIESGETRVLALANKKWKICSSKNGKVDMTQTDKTPDIFLDFSDIPKAILSNCRIFRNEENVNKMQDELNKYHQIINQRDKEIA